MAVWNPWHGCHKKSAGCLNCYMFRRDSLYDKNSEIIKKTKDFDLGIKKRRDGSYFIESGENVYICMTSDFFIEEADQWRNQIWEIVRIRQDLHFTIITKRIERFHDCIPKDWCDGYDNVTIICTCENQATTDERLPILLELPIKHKEIIHEPMLENINIEKYLQSNQIKGVTCGGESGSNAREFHYEWILNTREQCRIYQIPFYFKQTGANFVKDGKKYTIPRTEQMRQARKANINLNY